MKFRNLVACSKPTLYLITMIFCLSLEGFTQISNNFYKSKIDFVTSDQPFFSAIDVSFLVSLRERSKAVFMPSTKENVFNNVDTTYRIISQPGNTYGYEILIKIKCLSVN